MDQVNKDCYNLPHSDLLICAMDRIPKWQCSLTIAHSIIPNYLHPLNCCSNAKWIPLYLSISDQLISMLWMCDTPCTSALTVQRMYTKHDKTSLTLDSPFKSGSMPRGYSSPQLAYPVVRTIHTSSLSVMVVIPNNRHLIT